MKRSKLNKVSKQPISRLQRKIWQECRRICLQRDADSKGNISCFTCFAPRLEGSNRQLGHMWAKASLGAYLKYDIRLLRWQCARCNIWNGGMGADFYKRLKEEIGDKAMAELESDRNKTVKAYSHYEKLFAEYSLL